MRELIRVLDAIKKQIDAIAKHAETYDKTKEIAPSGPAERVRNEVDFPEEVKSRYYSSQGNNYRLQKRTFWVLFLTLLALAFYTCITYRQWQAMLASDLPPNSAHVIIRHPNC